MSEHPTFETFTRRKWVTSRTPFVSVYRSGVLGLNHAAYETLGRPPAVLLLFEREGKRIGLRPTTLDVDDAFRVRKQVAAKSYLISAQPFLQLYGISDGTTRRLPAALHDGLLVVSLREEQQ